jgi:CheY-like chemotaxis protein
MIKSYTTYGTYVERYIGRGFIGGHAMKVLVVDDEKGVREVIADALKSRGYEVVAAANATEAVDLFMKGGVDMITLDYMMPGMTGSQLQKLLSQEFGAGRRTTGFVAKKLPPILIVTAMPKDEEIMKAQFGEAVVGILPKPFSIKDLIDAVEGTIGPAKAAKKPKRSDA